MTGRRGSIEQRFWPKVDVCGPDECWLWNAALRSGGYGELWSGGAANVGEMVSAHRVSWELHYGAIANGLHVLHRCDTKRCVNPTHLFLGTNDDNVADKMAKGRHWVPRGEASSMAKMTDKKIREIRASKLKQTEIAKIYNVRQGYISKIITRALWSHVV